MQTSSSPSLRRELTSGPARAATRPSPLPPNIAAQRATAVGPAVAAVRPQSGVALSAMRGARGPLSYRCGRACLPLVLLGPPRRTTTAVCKPPVIGTAPVRTVLDGRTLLLADGRRGPARRHRGRRSRTQAKAALERA